MAGPTEIYSKRDQSGKALGWHEVPAVIVSYDDIDAELAEIDEDLVRSELTVLEGKALLDQAKDFDTTVKDTDCTYDHFVISDSLMDEYTGQIGVYRFDVEYGLTRKFSTKVSDHYPLFATFTVER
jgi:hypothetical protein